MTPARSAGRREVALDVEMGGARDVGFEPVALARAGLAEAPLAVHHHQSGRAKALEQALRLEKGAHQAPPAGRREVE